MKFTVDSKEFLQACTNVQKATPSKTVIPQLEGILIKSIDENTISLCCYDLVFAIKAVIPAVVEGEINLCINAKTLINVVKQIDGCITFTEKEKQTVNISGLNSNYNLMYYDVKDFPELPNVTTDESFDIKQKDFSDMIKQTIFSVSTDETKGAHTGIKFEVTQHKLSLVALDGYRFAIRENEIAYYDKDLSFVVPRATMNEVMTIANSKDNDMSIEKCENHVIFTIDNYTVISKLQSGEFLEYKRAIPPGEKFKITASPKDLVANINRCAVVIDEKYKSPLKMVFENDALTMQAETPIGNAKSSMAVDYKDETFTIGINHKYFKEALDACKDDEEVTVAFFTPTSPIIIRAENKMYLVLAVRI